MFWYIYGRKYVYGTWYPNDFWRKTKMYNFEPYNVLLSIATNIPVLLMTAFVLQAHYMGCDLLTMRFSWVFEGAFSLCAGAGVLDHSVGLAVKECDGTCENTSVLAKPEEEVWKTPHLIHLVLRLPINTEGRTLLTHGRLERAHSSCAGLNVDVRSPDTQRCRGPDRPCSPCAR